VSTRLRPTRSYSFTLNSLPGHEQTSATQTRALPKKVTHQWYGKKT
jgi:hypothetical protein